MAIRLDGHLPLSFHGLDADQIARMDVVVSKAKASADEAASLVPNALTRGWDTLIGASSSTEALQSNAAAAKTLYDTLQAKRDRLAADPNASESDVQVMEGSTYAMSNVASASAADQLSLTAFYDQVIAKTGSDIADAAKNPFGLPWWVWLAGAGVLALLVLVPRRK